MLKDAEQNFKKTTPVLMVQKGKGKGKAKPKDKVGPKSKGKGPKVPKPKPQKEGMCFHCNKPGHWKRKLPTLFGRAEEGKCDSLYFRYLCYRRQSFYFNVLGIRYWIWFSHLFKCVGAAK